MRSDPHSIPPSLSEQLLAGWWLLPLKLHRHVLLLLAAGATCATCLFILFVGVLLHHTTNEPDTDLLPLAHRGADGRLDSGAAGLWRSGEDGLREALKDASIRGRREQMLPTSPPSPSAEALAVHHRGADDAEDWLLPLQHAAMLLLCYNRPEYLQKTLASLFGVEGASMMPVYVSQDGDHAPTAAVARRFNVTLWQRPRVPLLSQGQQGQAYLAQHYKWALDRVLLEQKHSHAIVLEDDMVRPPTLAHSRPYPTLALPPKPDPTLTLTNQGPPALTCACHAHATPMPPQRHAHAAQVFSPDFVRFFAQTAWLLRTDPTLWCVSSWNDNGFESLVQPSDASRLFRTDFFPGLGWMLRRELWLELAPGFPLEHWDHWMRLGSTSKGRECAVPLVSRNFNIGVVGANMESSHYQKYLKHMRHNTDPSVRLAETHEVPRRAAPSPRRILAAPPARWARPPAPFHYSVSIPALPCPSPGHVRGLRGAAGRAGAPRRAAAAAAHAHAGQRRGRGWRLPVHLHGRLVRRARRPLWRLARPPRRAPPHGSAAVQGQHLCTRLGTALAIPARVATATAPGGAGAATRRRGRALQRGLCARRPIECRQSQRRGAARMLCGGLRVGQPGRRARRAIPVRARLRDRHRAGHPQLRRGAYERVLPAMPRVRGRVGVRGQARCDASVVPMRSSRGP